MYYYLLSLTDTKESFDVLTYEAPDEIESVKKTIEEKQYPIEITEIQEDYYYWLIERWYKPMW